jgi:crotonobetainyl-CoA:carnitine CoA-transferase CaiB-like acyl-CoA transferase
LPTFAPLEGVRVLSFELAFSLPAGTRALHDLGADVVRVSPPERRHDRYISVIDGVFHGKRSMGIDLTNDRGRTLARRLALAADVVCNNFRPAVLGKYGLDEATLRQEKPELICLQLSGYGTPGPWSNYPAFGPSTEAAGGFNRLMYAEDEIPTRLNTGVFSDQLAGRHAALAIVAALQRRRETGAGAGIDLSMTACITHLLGENMTRASMLAETPAFTGNRDDRFVPQGVYRTAGDDEWIAISVTSDEAWRALCTQLNNPQLHPRLDPDADRAARLLVHDDIDRAISEWTAPQHKDEIAISLQAIGVAAAPVRTVADAGLDPQFAARGTLQAVVHDEPKMGFNSHPHPVLPWHIDGFDRRQLTDYRHTGADNRTALADWLDVSSSECDALLASSALHEEGPMSLAPRPEGPPRDPNFGDKLGLR